VARLFGSWPPLCWRTSLARGHLDEVFGILLAWLIGFPLMQLMKSSRFQRIRLYNLEQRLKLP
jgi:hypothetical protein